MRKIEEEQLKLFYYFMMADGECTSEERDRFAQICGEMKVQPEDMSRIVRECELAVDTSGKNCAARVKAVIQELLKDDDSKQCYLTRDRRRQIYGTWNLINLGYADREYSGAERSLIKFLADLWKIDGKLLAEMLDVAETLLELTREREWIKTTSKPYDMIHKFIEETDRDMEKLRASMELTLEEAWGEV